MRTSSPGMYYTHSTFPSLRRGLIQDLILSTSTKITLACYDRHIYSLQMYGLK